MKFTRLTGILFVFLSVKTSYASYFYEIHEHNECSAKIFGSLVESFVENRINQRKWTENQRCSFQNSVCVYLGEEKSHEEIYKGFRATLFAYGNEISLIMSHDNHDHPIDLRTIFNVGTEIFNITNFECNSKGRSRKSNTTTTYFVSNDLCCIGQKQSLDQIPDSFPGVFTATKLSEKTLHLGLEIIICERFKYDLIGGTMIAQLNFNKFGIDQVIVNIGENIIIFRRETTEEENFNERNVEIYRIAIPPLASSFMLRSVDRKEIGLNVTEQKLVYEKDLIEDDDATLLNYFSEENDYFQERILEKIVLPNEKADMIRRRAIKSFLKLFPDLEPFGPIQLLNDKRRRIDSKLFKFSANSSLYRWTSGESEEWIFQEVESSLFPVLNHSIAQFTFLHDEGGWESVVITSPLFEASVYAIMDENLKYTKKVCRMNFNMGHTYNSLDIGYKSKIRGWLIETFMYGAEYAWELSVDAKLLKKLTNYVIKVYFMNIWTGFSESPPIANISMTLTNWPGFDQPLVELNLFNYKFLLEKLNYLVNLIVEVLLSRDSPVIRIFDLIQIFLAKKSQGMSAEMEKNLNDALKFRDFLLHVNIPKITLTEPVLSNIFVHMKSFTYKRKDENVVSISFTLKEALYTFVKMLYN